MESSSNGSSVSETEKSLEKIKKQLSSGSGKYLLQGPLLKRSETLHKWNERWVVLDPSTGRMIYKIKRNEVAAKGTIAFDANSTITISPVNLNGLPKYDGCCFYVGTPQKKDYFFCAETPGAARAWVATLHATQLVLRAHREAVNSLGENGSSKLGTVATVVAAANSTAIEAAKEIESAMQITMRAALGSLTNKPQEGLLDDLSVMKETLRVKDDELHQLARDIRARDSTIKEIAERLTDTAEAAEAAAAAARTMDEERKAACAEVERLTKEARKQLEAMSLKLRSSEEMVTALCKEKNELSKQRDSALQEAQLWRTELGKSRERAVILEAAVVRADERVRVSQVDAEARIKDVVDKQTASLKEREELLSCIKDLRAQRQSSSNEHKFEEKVESCYDTTPLTKHIDSSDGNIDKACLSISRTVPVAVEDGEYRVGDGEWGGFQMRDARITDVKEISPEAEGSSMDISVVSNTSSPSENSPQS